MLITVEEALARTRCLLERAGVPDRHACLQAEVLVESEMRGHASHGLQRLPRLLSRIRRGLVNVSAEGQREWRSRSYLSVNGEAGLGAVVAMATIDEMLRRLPETGIVVAGVRNANHIGMLAPYVERIATSGYIGMAFSSSEALVHPHGGAEAMLGTNPVAVAVPARDGEPFVLDLATSIVSMGKVHDYALRGKLLEAGWALDAEGNPTTDAESAKLGSLAPFGGAKGYGLGLAFELLVATIAGADFAPEVRGTLDDSHPANKGDVFIAIDAAREDMADDVADYLDRVRKSRPSPDHTHVSIPGDRARSRRDQAMAQGIVIEPNLWLRLTEHNGSTPGFFKEDTHSS